MSLQITADFRADMLQESFENIDLEQNKILSVEIGDTELKV